MKTLEQHGTPYRVILCRLLPSLLVLLSGCASHNLFFAEGTKIGFHAEFRPDASQPVNSSLGYKRRIVAVVPPQKVAEKGKNPQGEALSMVSLFSVGITNEWAGTMTVTNHFLAGGAARVATDPKRVEDAMKALRCPDPDACTPPKTQP